MTNKVTKYGIMVIAAVLLVAMAFAGAVSAAEPISTTAQWLDLNGKSGDYYLENDIDFKGGNAMIASFSGTLDGKNNTISNFVIDNSSEDNIGLIGSYSGSRIGNLTLSNFSVSGRFYVGGLVGYADSASYVKDSWVNVTEVSGSNNVGGLVGYADSASQNNASVMDCKIGISSVSEVVGGLVGYASSASYYDGCAVENCTIAGDDYVGGLVGDAESTSSFVSSQTWVNATWVNGRWDTGSLLGYGFSSKSGSPMRHSVWGSYGITTLVPTDNNFDNISTPEVAFASGIGSPIDIVPLIAGTDYGYGSAPKYSVTYDGNDNTSGVVPIDGNNPYLTGLHVTVLGNTGSLAKTGYNFTGWNKDSTAGQHYAASETFTITADTVFYANWTPYTYNVTFDNNTGTGIMENQTFTYDVAQTLSANTFTKSGYHFIGWNKTDAFGTEIDFTDEQSVMNLTNVDNGAVTLFAVWEQNPAPAPSYTSSSSKQSGYTIILHEGQVAPNQQPTVAPTVKPTAAPTDKPAVPTVAPTVKPTAQQTQKSPAPILGLIAGLGATAVLLRLRR